MHIENARLSVVVPLGGTAPQVRECLESLAAQQVETLEAVLVDDGTTSEAVLAAAEEATAGDARFRTVRVSPAPTTVPGRLGAARNAGLRHTDPAGRYVAFLDAEDSVPPAGYRRLLESLEETGSELATGNAVRLGNDGPGRTPLLGKPLDRDRPATHITRHRGLTRDRLAGTKVFRRAFLERHALRWEEEAGGTDVRFVLPAHFLAEAVDVVAGTVLHRRNADDGLGRSGAGTRRQRGPEALAAMCERVAALDAVSRFLAVHGASRGRTGRRRNPDKRHFDTAVITTDLAPLVAALPEADDRFRAEFARLAGAFASRIDPAVLTALPMSTRAVWYLLRQGRLDDVLSVLAFDLENPQVLPVVRRGGRRTVGYPRPDGMRIELPRRLGRVRSGEQVLEARLGTARWQPDDTLLLRGYAYIPSAPAERPERSRKFGWLRRGDGSGRRIPLRVRTVPAPEATRASQQRTCSYDASGFEVVVDPRRLARALDGGRRSVAWTVCLGTVTGGLVRSGGVLPGAEGSGAQPPVHELPGDRRALVTFGSGRLRILVEETLARLADRRVVDGILELTVDVRNPHRARTLRVTHLGAGPEQEHPVVPAEETGGTERWVRCTTRIPLASLPGSPGQAGTGPVPRGSERWRLTLVLEDGTTCRIVVPSGTEPLASPLPDVEGPVGLAREVYAGPEPHGHLGLTGRAVPPVADALRWDAAGALVLEGTLPRAVTGAPELVWQHSGHRQEVTAAVVRTGERFTSRLWPADAAPGGLPLRQGNWYPFLRDSGADTREHDVPLRLSPALLDTLPQDHPVTGPSARTFTAERRYHDRLFVRSGSDLPPQDRGAYSQHRLSSVHYPAARALPLRDAVLYESFDGRQYSDSPRAVHEELLRRGTDVEHLWAVRDGQAHVPPGAEPVVMGSARWHEALARSRWLVGNTHFPRWLARREGQTVVQTWHGTPLKRIGLDLADTAFSSRSYLSGLPARAAEWSVLVSPNRFSTPILRRAFGYEGEVLECGYPRNDVLYATDREKRAEEVRRSLGVPEGRRVVLYAPTWRDDDRYDRSNCRFDLRLDLAAARAALGDDHVLLVRKHYLVADSVPGTGDGFVRDVSAHPDVAELLLIADVLVTDYSSLMFDFAHTGRPMLFHTYDLEHYRDELRGFYFDFEQRAPGPLLSSSQELIAALRDVDAVAVAHHEMYAEFRRSFCDLDDGTAAARVADRMLGGPGEGG
ncbi:CDP-glycerol glycerophosphotransferase family protein [Streptomyces sp. TR06-5]|uniref:CDP-glycerol glycerophosphotransferase family protein n=1 Tax=Streptomyces sp. TR06-5 TaxID=3385976 RepID=UPI0039A09E63